MASASVPETGVPELLSELWRHSDPSSTRMWKFLQLVNRKYSLALNDYHGLYQWSIENIADFWKEVWFDVGTEASRPFDQVLPHGPIFPRPDFFSGARLNYAKNLLYPAGVDIDPSATALIVVTENDEDLHEITWAQLRHAVRLCTSGLRSAGVKAHDVVAGFVSNHEQALVAMLASSAIGAVWTSISPDNGVSAVLSRLSQVQPKVLFADNGSLYNGKAWSSAEKTTEIVAELAKHGLQLIIVIHTLRTIDLGLDSLRGQGLALEYEAFLNNSPDTPLAFNELPPSHPLYILFSSGTTGLPKAIVHSAAGTLLQHKKEHVFHCSMSSSSRMLYYTTTSWMMWHWSVSALACGTSLVLYSGSPFKPYSYLSLPKLLSSLKVTHFGTSAAYLTALEAANVRPRDDPNLDLSSLQAIYSTASPLPPSTFDFVYRHAFPAHINLASITGGTDIISLFGAPCPLLPVHAGEIQCAALGMAIKVIDADADPGHPRFLTDPDAEAGDLVCVQPFPCQPLTFWGPDGDAKYRAAYFDRFPGLWHHGDFIRINPATGGLIMLGRSDGVLKPAGVRFGSAEIYNILTSFFAGVVEDAVCVGRRRATDRDETVCLFVEIVPGRSLDDALKAEIKDTIRRELSPRHVPAVVEECGSNIPRTSNGKKIEVAVKKILSGMDAKVNDSVANPEALQWFYDWAARHR